MRVAAVVRVIRTEPNNLNFDFVLLENCGLPHKCVPAPEVGAVVSADVQFCTGWQEVSALTKFVQRGGVEAGCTPCLCEVIDVVDDISTTIGRRTNDDED